MTEENKPKDKIVIPPVDPDIVVIGHGYSLLSLEGIGKVRLAKLKQAGIRSLRSLLQNAATPKERSEIAKEVGTSQKQVLGWVKRADKFRVPGVGPEYAGLLESAGVDTVRELARRNPDNLYNKIIQVNESKQMVRKTPTKKQVGQWVSEAKELPRIIKY